MAKKFYSKALSVGLSLALCAGMVSPAFAASFQDLQDAIDNTEGTGIELDNGYFGYGKNEANVEGKGYDIWAKDNDGAREVELKGHVKREDNEMTLWVTGDVTQDLTLNLNGHDIDAQGKGGVMIVAGANLTVNGKDENGKEGSITGGNNVDNGYEDWGYGGGLNIQYSNVTLNDVKVTGNTAQYGGGGLRVQEGANVIINGGEISGNKASHAGGISVIGDEGDTSAIEINNSKIINNEATGDATQDEGGKYTGNGGGIIVEVNSTAKIDNTEFANNVANHAGGAINIYNNASAEITNSNIHDNKANGNHGGGGIIVDGEETPNGASAVIKNTTITDNDAGENGGAINAKNGKVEISGSTITGNSAGNNGGGIVAESTQLSIEKSTITGNRTDGNGGGIYVWNGTKATVNGSNISNNKAVESGDDIFGTDHAELEMMGDKSVGETLKDDNKGITGWYHDASDSRWSSSEYTEAETKQNGEFALKAAHDKYFNVIYKDGVGENDGAELQKSEVENGSKIPGYDNETPTREGYDFIGWLDEDGNEVDFEKSVGGDLVLVAQWEEAESEPTGSPEPTDPGIDIEEPDVPLGEEPEVEIEDPEVPLAGLFTRADAIGYLWEQTGSPDAELSDFPDVPEDHQWAVAIGWAQDMGIALPDEDGNFRPDDLVLRSSNEPEGELQQFLDRYAVFAGVELAEGKHFYAVEGALDDIIMGEDAQVIFDEFFAKLEAALTEQAA